jgi:hypothetical protein
MRDERNGGKATSSAPRLDVPLPVPVTPADIRGQQLVQFGRQPLMIVVDGETADLQPWATFPHNPSSLPSVLADVRAVKGAITRRTGAFGPS